MDREFVVDTHALIWFLEGNSRLGSKAKAVLEDPQNVLYLPVIALAEACWIVARGRTAIPKVGDLLNDIDRDPRVVVVPLDRAIVEASDALTVIAEMHDRLIVATVLQLSSRSSSPMSLLTVDGNITDSGVCPIVW